MDLQNYFNLTDPESFIPGVWKGKYADDGEITPDDMHRRMAKEFARVRARKDPSRSEVQWYDYFFNLLKNFKAIIPQGSIMASLGTDVIASLSNCFVAGQPEDSYAGIFYKDQQIGQLMKRRGGVGTDISTLRPNTVPVQNTAKSSTGAVSFMHRFSNTTREVAQDGRRGALMITIDCRHPDVLDFINVKRDRTAVTGANISVMLRDDFMEAVKKDEDYILRWPCETELPFSISSVDNEGWKLTDTYNPLVHNLKYNDLIDFGNGLFVKRVKAKEIYDAIIENAWENAEPGQMFIDRQWDYSPDSVYPQYKGVTTNPCGEIFMQYLDACRLLCLNLLSVVKNPFEDNAEIDYKLLYNLSYEMMLMADDIVDLEVEYIDRIISKIKSDPEPDDIKVIELELWQNIQKVASSSRRTGNGITGLGDMFGMLGLPYDSGDALIVADEVMRTKMEAELDATIEMARRYGPFKGWNGHLEFYERDGKLFGQNDFYQMICDEFPLKAWEMFKYGRRNVSWSTIAPTGTVSVLGKAIKHHNISAGCEPHFNLWFMRKKKINPSDENARVDSVDQNGDSWQHFPIVMGAFKDFYDLKHRNQYNGREIEELSPEELEMVYKTSPWYGSTANDINWTKRVVLQSILQKYTSHSISSTINLPNDVTKEEVAKIYMEAYNEDLKGVTVYRDGCRTGVLVKSEDDFKVNDAPKRPKVLDAVIHKSVRQGTEWLIIVGMYKNKPYEIFCTENEYDIKNTVSNGTVTKIKRGEYSLDIPDILTIDKLSTIMSDEEQTITRLISTSLRHGADIKFIVEQLHKTPGDLQSFSKVIARTLKKYIPDDTVGSGSSCDECGSENLKYQEGCLQCTDCGHSKC